MAKWQFKKSEIPCLLSQLYRFIGFFIYKETETAVIFITSSIHGTLGCSLGHGLLHVLCMCLDWVESRYPSNSAPLSLLGLCGLCGRVEAVKRRALGQFSVQGSVLKFSLAFTRPPRMNFPQHKRQKKYPSRLPPFNPWNEYAAVHISPPPAHIRVRNFPILPKILTCSFTNRMD